MFRTFGYLLLSEGSIKGHGQHLYTGRRIQSLMHNKGQPAGRRICFETKSCFCNRRIDLPCTENGMRD